MDHQPETGRLVNRMVLRDLAGENLADLERDADQALTAFVYQAEDRDVGFAFTRAAAHGGLGVPSPAGPSRLASLGGSFPDRPGQSWR